MGLSLCIPLAVASSGNFTDYDRNILRMHRGFIAWFLVRYLAAGLFTVNQNERAVKTSFGRAERVGNATTAAGPDCRVAERRGKGALRLSAGARDSAGRALLQMAVGKGLQSFRRHADDEHGHRPGRCLDANNNGTILEAVTKDQLNTGLKGQIRWRVSERNLYAYLFGVKHPITHVMGYFVSVLRERIANFEAPPAPRPAEDPGAAQPGPATAVIGISINDLRKNLRDINDHMDRECAQSAARYGIALDASLITGIDPPPEVESALAAINTAYNQVSSDISLAQAAADQKIVQSKRAVEIETLKAQAEVQPIVALAEQLARFEDKAARARWTLTCATCG